MFKPSNDFVLMFVTKVQSSAILPLDNVRLRFAAEFGVVAVLVDFRFCFTGLELSEGKIVFNRLWPPGACTTTVVSIISSARIRLAKWSSTRNALTRFNGGRLPREEMIGGVSSDSTSGSVATVSGSELFSSDPGVWSKNTVMTLILSAFSFFPFHFVSALRIKLKERGASCQ